MIYIEKLQETVIKVNTGIVKGHYKRTGTKIYFDLPFVLSGPCFWCFCLYFQESYLCRIEQMTRANKVFHHMKTKNIKAKETENWALPGNPIPLDEFKSGIKKAEKGPFYTIGESKKILEEWRKKRNSR